MNLTKYFMLEAADGRQLRPDRHAVDLEPQEVRQRRTEHAMNWAGDSHDAYSVIIDSALGLLGSESPKDKDGFPRQIDWLQGLPAQQAAAEVSVPDRRREGRGRQGGLRPALRDVSCERPDRHARCRSPTIGTNRERIDTWGKDVAVAANKVVDAHGHRAQGSRRSAARSATTRHSSTASGCARRTCTTARCRRCATCSSPSDKRPKVFYRGYDVYDPVRVGFVVDRRRRASARARNST